MTARTAAWIGGSVAALCVISQLTLAILALTTAQPWDVGLVPNVLGFPVVGAIIVSRQPRNTIGWLLIIGGASISLGSLCQAIVRATLDGDPAIWQRILALVANITFIGGFEGLVMAIAFLFPTGRALSRRWRMAGIAVAVSFVLPFVVLSFRSGPTGGVFSDMPEMTNPFVIPGVDTVADHAGFLFIPLGLTPILISLCALVARVRRAHGVERLQLHWLALAFGVGGVSVTFSVLANALGPDSLGWLADLFGRAFFLAGTIGVSIAIGIAILRYRLYDIERLINRGLVYLALTASLVLVYLGMVLLLGGVLRSLTGESSSIVTAASTLVAVALFTPLRANIQRIVDRRFYRRKYDAVRMVEDFSVRLRSEVDLNALSVDLQSVVNESMQPAHVSLWLRPGVARRESMPAGSGRTNAGV